MLEVLLFSQKDVKARLLERAAAPGVLLVTGVRHSAQMRAIPEREPFRSLERLFGDVLTVVVVADDGTPEGMWRDPVGDLADRLYPQDRAAAYAAASGYLVLVDGEPDAVVKKSADPLADAWFVQEALAAAHPDIPRPDPARKPRKEKAAPEAGADPRSARDPAGAGASSRHRESAARGSRQDRMDPGEGVEVGWSEDPWALLGITQEVSLAEARKAFRALIAQYHPDKVAHLAPEFRALAEKRTRQIVAAWEHVERELE